MQFHRQMPLSWPFLVIVALWALTGPALGLLMSRLGHSARSWVLLGTFFGPISILFTFRAIEDRPPSIVAIEQHPQHRTSGLKNVLVGIDGSVESSAAMYAAVALLDSQLGLVTLAAVIDFETALPDGRPIGRQRAEDDLTIAASNLRSDRGIESDWIILTGRPAAALEQFATDNCQHVIAIGTRGRGLSKELLGSVAADITRTTRRPVLLATAKTDIESPSPVPDSNSSESQESLDAVRPIAPTPKP